METNIKQLEALQGLLEGLPDDKLHEINDVLNDEIGDLPWYPNPGPQLKAYKHEADEIYFGGSAGGGKSDLLLGLAHNEHQRSLLLRRFNDDSRDMAERYLSVIGHRVGYNGQQQIYRDNHRIIRFGGCKDEGDKERYKGRPFDFYGFDEIGDFTESQYEFITTWNRSATGHRCRVVCTGNPPTKPDGLWVIERWRAWLDPKHPDPAMDGEIRWFTSDENGDEIEVDGPGPHFIGGRETIARSRTFIRAKLSDNPDLADTNYDAVLSNLPIHLRRAYRDGDFVGSLQSATNQMIPTNWIQEAQERWTDRPVRGIPMCNLAADIAQGGDDFNTIMCRHDSWFSEIEKIPGSETPLGGKDVAGMLIAKREDKCPITVDCGGGYGGVVYDKLLSNDIDAYAYKGAENATGRSADQTRLAFTNKRTEAYWRLREALDPNQEGGSDIMLPPNRELLRQLAMPTFELERQGIKMESKKDVVKKLGCSPDEADVCIMTWYKGDKAITHASLWRHDAMQNRGKKRFRQKVNPGYSAKYARRSK